jgi:hypothetical protein
MLQLQNFHQLCYGFDKLINFHNFLTKGFDVNREIIRIFFKLNNLFNYVEKILSSFDMLSQTVSLPQLYILPF